MENIKSMLERLKLVEKVDVKPEVLEQTFVFEASDEDDSDEEISDGKVSDEQISAPEAKPVTQPPSNKRDPIQTDKLLNADEIYEKFNLTTNGRNTIFMIDSFSKALPDYLPAEVKRQSVLNILSSSGSNVVDLLKDGHERLKTLKTFQEDSSNFADKIVSEYENEIQRLMEKIDSYKEEIDKKKKLQEEQKAIVEYETQKIHNIVNFINPLDRP